MKTVEPSQASTFGDWAYLAIEKHLQKILHHEEDVLKDKDPEALHQMRVGMRRLRSVLRGFDDAILVPKAAREKNIGDIAKKLGDLRDLDVLIDRLAQERNANLPGDEQETLDSVLEILNKQRKRIFSKVKKTLLGKSYFKLIDALTQWLQEPNYKPAGQFPIEFVLAEILTPEVSRLFLHPGWLIDQRPPEAEGIPSLEEDETLHSLRKQVKRVRYQMSLFTYFYGDNYANYVEDLKAIQEELGNLQDIVVLKEVLIELLGEPIENQLPTLAEKLSNIYQEAWLKWQPLQQKYFLSETRKQFYLELLNPTVAG